MNEIIIDLSWDEFDEDSFVNYFNNFTNRHNLNEDTLIRLHTNIKDWLSKNNLNWNIPELDYSDKGSSTPKALDLLSGMVTPKGSPGKNQEEITLPEQLAEKIQNL